tara:strand:- start:15 stop:281 length:267 start_codon:yes stop_codon:yes gene_type:complete
MSFNPYFTISALVLIGFLIYGLIASGTIQYYIDDIRYSKMTKKELEDVLSAGIAINSQNDEFESYSLEGLTVDYVNVELIRKHLAKFD